MDQKSGRFERRGGQIAKIIREYEEKSRDRSLSDLQRRGFRAAAEVLRTGDPASQAEMDYLDDIMLCESIMKTTRSDLERNMYSAWRDALVLNHHEPGQGAASADWAGWYEAMFHAHRQVERDPQNAAQYEDEISRIRFEGPRNKRPPSWTQPGPATPTPPTRERKSAGR